jgi:DNA-binding TFAR19-related protein (PDSD5 family)
MFLVVVVERDIELIKRRMLLEMQRKMLAREAKKPAEVVDYYSVFLEHLTEDGREMFNRALEQYGEVARKVAVKIGQLYHLGRLSGSLDASAVYWVFQEIGLPIRMETRIVYKKGGEVKSISDMLKEEEE